MKHLDKVAAYFDNELGATEEQEFLKNLESNPQLKSEFNFQSELINGIQEARKAELKAVLTNVPIIAINISTVPLYKLLGSITAILLAGTTLWYYYFTPTTEHQLNKNIVEQTPLGSNNGTNTNNDLIETPAMVTPNANIISDEKEKPLIEIANRIVNQPPKSASRKMVIPVEPNSEEFTAQSIPNENLEIPSSIGQFSINLSTKVDVEIRLKKKYNFHYQFLEGKLILYGEFETKPFEVIEVNGTDNSNLYLFYKSNYYSLTKASGEITPLIEVTDPTLKNMLINLNR